ncbi:MAG TPA: hypothetical protein VNE83_01210 [Terriglobales bacterium]|nr:hypothetical protein [Terriglobales bacterium]
MIARRALLWDLHLLAHALARPPETVAKQVMVLWKAPRRSRQWAEALLLAARDAYPETGVE